jgi:hypothetical protein
MLRLQKVFLSIESTAGTSLLSTYSISGLLKESQDDIVSSIETDIPSDLPGDDKSILLETGTLKVLPTNGTTTSFLTPLPFLSENEELVVLVVMALGKTTVADLTFDKVGFLLPEIAELEELHSEGSFFVFATLVTKDDELRGPF